MFLSLSVFVPTLNSLSQLLAEIVLDYLSTKEDYVKSMRGLLREVIKATRFQLNLLLFCKTMMDSSLSKILPNMENAIQVRLFL